MSEEELKKLYDINPPPWAAMPADKGLAAFYEELKKSTAHMGIDIIMSKNIQDACPKDLVLVVDSLGNLNREDLILLKSRRNGLNGGLERGRMQIHGLFDPPQKIQNSSLFGSHQPWHGEPSGKSMLIPYIDERIRNRHDRMAVQRLGFEGIKLAVRNLWHSDGFQNALHWIDKNEPWRAKKVKGYPIFKQPKKSKPSALLMGLIQHM